MYKKWVKIKSGFVEIDCMIKIFKGDKKDNVVLVKVWFDFWFIRVEGEWIFLMKILIVEVIVNDCE